MTLLIPADPAALPAAGQAGLDEAARLLREGGLVAFPTETVYGLGAHALDVAAVARIFQAKGRPADNPLIVHVAEPAQLDLLALHVPPLAARLAERFWPGPLTLVLDARPDVPRLVTAGLDTVAVRIPAHPVAQALLAAAGVPVAAPSANRSGRPSPTTAQHVLDDLGELIDAVVDGGPCRVGVESTVVDARGAVPVILREGAVTREELGVETVDASAEQAAASPGTRHAHYQPRCHVVLAAPGEAAELAAELARQGERVGLIAAAGPPGGVSAIGRFRDAAELAAHLYDWLRQAEAAVDVVVVETVPETGLGRAVMDRVRRAAGA